jgi:hypothetical protein
MNPIAGLDDAEERKFPTLQRLELYCRKNTEFSLFIGSARLREGGK